MNNDNSQWTDLTRKFERPGEKPKKEKRHFGKALSAQTSKIVRWVVKHSGGLIKTEKQANYVLSVISIVFILVSLFLFFGIGSENNKKLEEKERLLLEEIVSSTM